MISCKWPSILFVGEPLQSKLFSAFASCCSCIGKRTCETKRLPRRLAYRLGKSNGGADAGQPATFRSKTIRDAAERLRYFPLAKVRALPQVQQARPLHF